VGNKNVWKNEFGDRWLGSSKNETTSSTFRFRSFSEVRSGSVGTQGFKDGNVSNGLI
jgi:hypothetical protein